VFGCRENGGKWGDKEDESCEFELCVLVFMNVSWDLCSENGGLYICASFRYYVVTFGMMS
jgi:hypothetical protein